MKHIASTVTGVLLLLVSPAAAQDTWISDAGEIAASGELSVEYEEDCGLEDCLLVPLGWRVEPAFYLTGKLALVGSASGVYTTVRQPLGDDFGTISVNASVYSFGSGLRLSGRRSGRTVPFVQALGFWTRAIAQAEALGLTVSETAGGFGVEPSAGIDIAVAKRLALRLQSGYKVGYVDGERGGQFFASAGIVVGF